MALSCARCACNYEYANQLRWRILQWHQQDCSKRLSQRTSRASGQSESAHSFKLQWIHEFYDGFSSLELGGGIDLGSGLLHVCGYGSYNCDYLLDLLLQGVLRSDSRSNRPRQSPSITVLCPGHWAADKVRGRSSK